MVVNSPGATMGDSTSASVIVDVNGVVNFPLVDVEKIPVAELRVLLEDYLKKCWGNMFHRTPGKTNELPVPWDEIASDPSKFYDNQKFTLPLGLKFPQTMNSVETLMLGEFFNSIRDSMPFHFTPDASRPETVPAPSDQQVERTPSLPPIPPLSTENSMSEQGKQQSGDKPSELDSNETPQSPVSTPLTQRKRKRSKKQQTSNDPNGKQDHESEKELEIVPKKPRNETGKPASASEPAIRRSSRTTAPRKESTTQKTGKSMESRSAEVKKKSKLPNLDSAGYCKEEPKDSDAKGKELFDVQLPIVLGQRNYLSMPPPTPSPHGPGARSEPKIEHEPEPEHGAGRCVETSDVQLAATAADEIPRALVSAPPEVLSARREHHSISETASALLTGFFFGALLVVALSAQRRPALLLLS
ncbi:hypothetical protein B0H14DRAFT_3612586 [Mycena olivaceomarginata]|nr:hypothetical protein B0H14DRAFT_3612586 [Mycena olivaceomarginata]